MRNRRSLPVAVNLMTLRLGVSMELFKRLSIYALIYGKRNCFFDFLGVAYIKHALERGSFMCLLAVSHGCKPNCRQDSEIDEL